MFSRKITRLQDVALLNSSVTKPSIVEVTNMIGCHSNEVTALEAKTSDDEKVLLFVRTERLQSTDRSHEVMAYHLATDVAKMCTLQYDIDHTNHRLI